MEPKPTKKRNRSLQFISNNVTRNTSWKKRQPTLKLKAQQLATLCDVSVCLLCFGPDGKLDTWPEIPAQVREIIMNYKNCGKASENLDLSSFLKAKRRKTQEENREINRVTEVENAWRELPKAELMTLIGSLDFTLQRLRERRDKLLNNNNLPLQSANGFENNMQEFRSENEKINNGDSDHFVPTCDMFDCQSTLIPPLQVVDKMQDLGYEDNMGSLQDFGPDMVDFQSMLMSPSQKDLNNQPTLIPPFQVIHNMQHICFEDNTVSLQDFASENKRTNNGHSGNLVPYCEMTDCQPLAMLPFQKDLNNQPTLIPSFQVIPNMQDFGFEDNMVSLQHFGSDNENISNGGSGTFVPSCEMFEC